MTKETKRNIGQYALSSLSVYLFSLIFGLLGLIFIVDAIPKWVQFIVSFVFMAPTLFITYTRGKAQGEKLFKDHAKTTLDDLHSERALTIPSYKCVFHVLGFVVPVIIILILAVAIKSNVLQLVGVIFEFPLALMFMSVGVLNLANPSGITLAIFIPYTLIVAGMFILGYLLTVYRLKRRHADIKGELRMFDN